MTSRRHKITEAPAKDSPSVCSAPPARPLGPASPSHTSRGTARDAAASCCAQCTPGLQAHTQRWCRLWDQTLGRSADSGVERDRVRLHTRAASTHAWEPGAGLQIPSGHTRGKLLACHAGDAQYRVGTIIKAQNSAEVNSDRAKLLAPHPKMLPKCTRMRGAMCSCGRARQPEAARI